MPQIISYVLKLAYYTLSSGLGAIRRNPISDQNYPVSPLSYTVLRKDYTSSKVVLVALKYVYDI